MSSACTTTRLSGLSSCAWTRNHVRHEALIVAVREVVPAAGRRSGRSNLEAGRTSQRPTTWTC